MTACLFLVARQNCHGSSPIDRDPVSHHFIASKKGIIFVLPSISFNRWTLWGPIIRSCHRFTLCSLGALTTISLSCHYFVNAHIRPVRRYRFPTQGPLYKKHSRYSYFELVNNSPRLFSPAMHTFTQYEPIFELAEVAPSSAFNDKTLVENGAGPFLFAVRYFTPIQNVIRLMNSFLILIVLVVWSIAWLT